MPLPLNSISLADSRFVFRLMGELCELRADQDECASHLIRRLSQRTGGVVAGVGRRLAVAKSGSCKGIGHICGCTPNRVRQTRQFLEHPEFVSPVSDAVLRTARPTQVIRGSVVGTDALSPVQRELYTEYVRTVEIGDSLMAKSDRSALPGFVGTIWIRRGPGERVFSPDDAALLGVVNAALEDWFWPSYTGWLGGPEVRVNFVESPDADRRRLPARIAARVRV